MTREAAALWLAAVLAACASPAPPRAAPPRAAPPAAPPAAAPARVLGLGHDGPTPIPICVLEEGELRYVQVLYSTGTGDTVTYPDRHPFREVHRAGPQYAGDARWYINSEMIEHAGRRYPKYGLPRELGIADLARVGEYRGVPLFAERGAEGSAVLYVPVRPGCVFQPYMIEYNSRAVRGGR